MKQSSQILAIILALFTISTLWGQGTASSSYDTMRTYKQRNSQDKALTESINHFGFDIYPRLIKPGKNLCFSPLSINAALSMVAAGARNETLTEMREVLHFKGENEEHHNAYTALIKELNSASGKYPMQLEMANAVYVGDRYSPHLNPLYFKLVKTKYLAEVFTMSTSNPQKASDTINKWVATKTRHKIPTIVSKDDMRPDLAMLLLNSIYFKANWSFEFASQRSHKQNFYPNYQKGNPGNPIETMMMSQKGRFPYAKNAEVQILELSYKGEEFSMYFLLPENMAAFEKKLNSAHFFALISKLNIKNQVQVSIPKYKIEQTMDLTKIMKDMGMPLAFMMSKADFGDMLVPETELSLYIDLIKHKTFIEVDEKGTEAAAVTAVSAMAAGSGRSVETVDIFYADHPFIYALVHKPSMSILFLGKVHNPALK